MLCTVSRAMRVWSGAREGTTAIEFSLLAVPFVYFVVGIIELSLLFVGSSTLQGAVFDAARKIRTGQVQQAEGDDPEDVFREALCAHATLFLDCDAIQYQVEPLDSFADADDEELELDDDGNLVNQPFDPGGSGDIVMIRVVYLYPMLTPVIGEFFSDYPGNKKLITATVVIETEPYEFDDE